MRTPFAKTKLFGESLLQRKVAEFSLSERFYSPFFKTPSHSHDKALFCFVVKGTYTETYGNRVLHCSPSSLLFHDCGVPHAEHYHQSGGHSFIVELESAWLTQVREQISFPEYSVDFGRGPLTQLGARLYNEFQCFDPLSPMIIEGVMMEIAGETARQTFDKKNLSPIWLKRVERLLKERFSENLPLSEIAEFAGVHPVHLAQTFRRFHRTTVGQFVRDLRLENARHQIGSGKASLTEIAFGNGFSDQSHLSRLFRQKYGVTPGEYRRNFR